MCVSCYFVIAYCPEVHVTAFMLLVYVLLLGILPFWNLELLKPFCFFEKLCVWVFPSIPPLLTAASSYLIWKTFPKNRPPCIHCLPPCAWKHWRPIMPSACNVGSICCHVLHHAVEQKEINLQEEEGVCWYSLTEITRIRLISAVGGHEMMDRNKTQGQEASFWSALLECLWPEETLWWGFLLWHLSSLPSVSFISDTAFTLASCSLCWRTVETTCWYFKWGYMQPSSLTSVICKVN